MEILIKATQLILSLGILILFHEFGHYITARMFKTRVDKFYLFFDFLFPLPSVLNFSLFKKKIGDTEYGIGWFPMGGYVQIAGMIDENLNTEQMKKPAEPWEFRSKKPWQRLIIMLGGIIVNVLLAFIIYAMVLFVWGEKKLPMSQMKDGVDADSVALKMGFLTGDKIVSVDGKSVFYFSDLRKTIFSADTVVVNRNGKQLAIALPVDLIDKVAKREGSALLYPRFPFYIEWVPDSSHNAKAGLRNRDRVIAINDSICINYYDEWEEKIKDYKGKTISLTVIRNNKEEIVPIVKVNENGLIGVSPIANIDSLDKVGFFHLEKQRYGFFASFPAGVKKTWSTLSSYIDQFKLMFSPETGAYKHMGGFISMGKIFGAEWNWHDFWERTALISIILAFMNLLPIPALDGGHVVFTLWEMITRRPPSIKVLTYSQYVGMAFLLLLMLYANLNDIVGFFK